MKKQFFSLLLVLLFVPAVATHADTIVSGTISEDTTWDTAGNTYIVSNNVTVASGVTLTI